MGKRIGSSLGVSFSPAIGRQWEPLLTVAPKHWVDMSLVVLTVDFRRIGIIPVVIVIVPNANLIRVSSG
jgi:hypothetical protein